MVTGDPIGKPLTGHEGAAMGVAIGRARDLDVIISGSHDPTVFLRQRTDRDRRCDAVLHNRADDQ